MTLNELARTISSPLMADRETIDDAFEYALMVAKGTDNPMAVMTAIYVVTNTIAKQIKEIENA
jgi:hypothetical protein